MTPLPSYHVGKFNSIKSGLNINDCVRQFFSEELYNTELASVLNPLPQETQQVYKYRIESIKEKAKGKFSKDLTIYGGNSFTKFV